MAGNWPSVGLYSIGVDLPVPRLLTWATESGIPFVHLRGGARGHRLPGRSEPELAAWHDLTGRTVPITLVTADLELDDLLAGDPSALAELSTMQACARTLGARGVRVLATTGPHRGDSPGPAAIRGAGPLLIEPHSAAWYSPAGLDRVDRLLGQLPDAALLVDSLQFDRHAQDVSQSLADRLVECARVVHLSDHGAGFGRRGHHLIARALRRALTRTPAPEVGYEWTGPDRTPRACLANYRRAVAWLEGVR